MEICKKSSQAEVPTFSPLAKAGGRPRTERRKAGKVRRPACGLNRRERGPLRSVRGALFFWYFSFVQAKEKYNKLAQLFTGAGLECVANAFSESIEPSVKIRMQ